MAKQRSPKLTGFNRSIRNRGEDIGEASRPIDIPYDYNPNYTASDRPLKRREVTEIYSEMYQNEQRRDQRAEERVRDLRNEFFAGVDPRRKQEIADAGMIQEDHQAIANLSQRPINREYPKSRYYSTQYLDDIINDSY